MYHNKFPPNWIFFRIILAEDFVDLSFPPEWSQWAYSGFMTLTLVLDPWIHGSKSYFDNKCVISVFKHSIGYHSEGYGIAKC
jgi:hypothetical protein